MEKKQVYEKAQSWIAGWMEKVSIVAVFNGLFADSEKSFWLGAFCGLVSFCLHITGGKKA